MEEPAPLPSATTLEQQEPAFSIASFPRTVPPRLLRKVTCGTASAKLILLGYADGAVALFDVFGNPLDEHFGRHDAGASVVSVALGRGATANDVAASAAADGTIRANALLNPSAPAAAATLNAAASGGAMLRTRCSRGVKVLAVDPEYGRPRSGERVAYADDTGRVVLFTSGWFGGSEVVVGPAEGNVHAIAWSGLLVAWSTDTGVKMYDTRLRRVVCAVETPSFGMDIVGAAADALGVDIDSLAADTDTASHVDPSEGGNKANSSAAGNGAPDAVSAAVVGNMDKAKHVADDTSIEVDRAPSLVDAQLGQAYEGSGQHHTSSSSRASAAIAGNEQAGAATDIGEEISQWRPIVSLKVDSDEDEPLSMYGERTITLYVAWPSVCKVISIGPHVDVPAARTSDGQEPSPPRKIETITTVHRSEIVIGRDNEEYVPNPASPILAIAPFGDNFYAVLVGSAAYGLSLARVQRGVVNAMQDVRFMPLEHKDVVSGDMVAIPGGDPLLLIHAEDRDMYARAEGAADDDEEGEPIDDNEPLALMSSYSSAAGASATTLVKSGPRHSCVSLARALGVAERIKWMLDQGRFQDALSAAEMAPRGSLLRAEVSIADVGDQFLESIRDSGDFRRLAEVLNRTIVSTSPNIATRGRDNVMQFRRERWNKWIAIFRNGDKLAEIATNIPCHDPRMSEELYNSVLVELVATNPITMLRILQTWPADVYDVAAVAEAAESRSAELRTGVESGAHIPDLAEVRDMEALREALFMLYGLSGRHDETLFLLLRERSDRIFEYIRSHSLYQSIQSEEAIREMFTIDASKSTDVLVNAPGTVLPPECVVPTLDDIGQRDWLCMYLYAVFDNDQERATQYHNTLVELLVEHGKDGQLDKFLRTSTHFSLDASLRLMGGRNGKGRGKFGRERVYVLATMGDLNAAMNIMLHELGDVHEAIEFASEHKDASLWDRLIEHARGNADTLAALLDSPAGGKVNPMRLIPLISTNMEIPHLRDRLHRILVDAALERTLREDTAAALRFDAGRYMDDLDAAILQPI